MQMGRKQQLPRYLRSVSIEWSVVEVELQQYPTPAEKPQSTAEQDMEIIRSKRATSTAGATGAAGQPKSKYRKRSVRVIFIFHLVI
jgi:hypothetical protein